MFYNGKKLRHELKYYINYNQYIDLKNKLKGIMEMDKHSLKGNGYLIQSLYFDDVYDTALYEKNYGVFSRKKIRIRAYNFADDFIRLETKGKYGSYIYKDSAKLTRKEYDNILKNEIDFLVASNDPVKHYLYSEIVTKRLRPSVIVDYDREAFTLPVSDVRITFDKELKATTNTIDLFSRDQVRLRAMETNLMIMEVKFNSFLPAYIKGLLNAYTFNYCAISKYVLCRETLNRVKYV